MNEKETKKTGALTLTKKIFEERGVKFEELDENRYGFYYDLGDGYGEHIIVDADDEHLNVKLTDFCWHEVSKWDVEEVAKIQSCVNSCNSFSRSKVVYHFDDNDKMVLSSMITFPLYEGIEHISDYFSAQVNNLMQTHEIVLGVSEEDTEDDSTTGSDEATTSNEEGGEA